MTPTTGVPEPSAPKRLYMLPEFAAEIRTVPLFVGEDIEYVRADAAESLIWERVAGEIEGERRRILSQDGPRGPIERLALGVAHAAAFVRKGARARSTTEETTT